MKPKSKQQQHKNRRALADIIEHRLADKQFNMAKYANDCGTVGCALGVAALCGEIEGLGWNKHPTGGLHPVANKQALDWHEAAKVFFGTTTGRDVFMGDALKNRLRAGRKEVADALRKIPLGAP